jgi:hypothetical protein
MLSSASQQLFPKMHKEKNHENIESGVVIGNRRTRSSRSGNGEADGLLPFS